MDSYQFAWVIVLLASSVVVAGALVVFVYVAVRAAAVAWYRTRWEHLRKVWKHIGKNGDEIL